MIKRTISTAADQEHANPEWLRVDELAEVEITSEEPAHPIEAALIPGDDRGWRAAAPGRQTIRVRFGRPQAVRHVQVVFEERARTRTQEFVLRVAASPDEQPHDLVRQHFNFSPAGATCEREDYRVHPPVVATLELTITPDVRGGDARASLQQLRIG